METAATTFTLANNKCCATTGRNHNSLRVPTTTTYLVSGVGHAGSTPAQPRQVKVAPLPSPLSHPLLQWRLSASPTYLCTRLFLQLGHGGYYDNCETLLQLQIRKRMMAFVVQ
ncbi:unnamed protein product [Danaus chrysippus]|uniref:(African queen) hypothetical protein n=1 Tax=Danaus chrysippus TaxID=151541 RepID=A0A8J2R9A2_9NEOP|nr:unnamed protein product [Danaus chrysippus]